MISGHASGNIFNQTQSRRLSPEILARTGVRLYHQEAIDLLKKAGASVSDGTLVRVPDVLIDKALRTVPKRVAIYDRQGQSALALGDRRCHYGTGSDCLNIVDDRV